MRKVSSQQKARICLLIYIAFVFSSCNPISYSSAVKYINLSDYNCENKATNILLFFEGENTNFAYKKLGLIEINQYHDAEMTFDLMKQKAHEMCGNAIVGIKKTVTSEIYTDKYNKIKTYNKINYSGIAVFFENESEFITESKNVVDTNFLTRNRIKDQKLNDPGSRALGVFLGVIVSICYAIIEVLPE